MFTRDRGMFTMRSFAPAGLASPIVLLLLLSGGLFASPDTVSSAQNSQAVQDFERLPLGFEWNQGQTDPAVKAYARGPRYSFFLTSDEAVLSLAQPGHRHSVIRWKPVNANPHARIEAVDPVAAQVNYFIGNDPAKWRKNVVPFGKVKYSGVYPGVDLVYYGNQDQIEYDFRVAPHADPKSIVVSVSGADRQRIDPAGNLVMETKAGPVVHHKPYIYQQDVDGKRAEIQGKFILEGKNLRFAIGTYDHDRTLVIDPSLNFSTYLGGSQNDRGLAVSTDALGDVFVVGSTASLDFPTTANAPYKSLQGGTDGFVTVFFLGSAKSFYLSSYIGGSGDDEVDAVSTALVPPEVYIAGTTTSTDFPLVGAIQQQNGGGKDVFIAKLAFPDDIAFSTYFGGSGDDSATSLALDVLGNINVVGKTSSTDMPTLLPTQNTNAGGFDGFLVQLTNVGAPMLFSTYLGGSFDDEINAVAANGVVVSVAGDTKSLNFGRPAWPNISTTSQAFVAAFDTSEDTKLFQKLFGGNKISSARAIAVDTKGNSFVAGYTNSTNFPVTSNALQPANAGLYDAFVTKLNSTGGITYATYFGGSGSDLASSLGIDSSGNVIFAGGTTSTNFPTASSIQAAYGGGATDGFLVKLNANLTSVAMSSYFGGSGTDLILGMNVGTSGNVVVVGSTDSTDLPVTAGVVQATNKGGTDAFAAKIIMK